MPDLSLSNGNLNAAVSDDNELILNLTRFGEVEDTTSLDVSIEGLERAADISADSVFAEAQVVDLSPDGNGGAWITVQRAYVSAEDGDRPSSYWYAGYTDVEYIALNVDSELDWTGPPAQVGASGDLLYVDHDARSGYSYSYDPVVSTLVLEDGDLVLGFGASIEEASDRDALPFNLVRFDADTGDVLFDVDTGLRGEPQEIILDTSGEEDVLAVTSTFPYQDPDVYWFQYLDAHVSTRHDAETGELLEPAAVTSENFSYSFSSIYDDEFVGTDDADDIVDLGGNNVLQLAGGNDTLTLQDGDDLIDAGFGDDVITTGDGRKGVSLGGGNDRLTTGDGDDHISGAEGHDTIFSGGGDDLIGGGPGNDDINTGSGNDTVRGGRGGDTIVAEGSAATLSGGIGTDDIGGTNGGDLIAGGYGDDTIRARGGNDTIGGGTGHDVIDAGRDDDVVYAGAGRDRIDGGLGDDDLNGGFGNDTLAGRDGDDRLNGGRGNDILRGDRYDGQDGYDIFVFSRLTTGETDYIQDFEHFEDRMEISGIEGDTAADQFAQLEIGFAVGSDGEAGSYVRVEGHTIILDGFFPGDLTVDDFLFV
ncbi:hypothetical protein LVO79_18380 (plasmid) [Roseivivax marinus]|uniref:calcium-binding protein n=1 Tax=Roseivivax marinus TaxID=1379903 RepID=UPI001F045F1F|nr:calcium-binding protein [Roseivivax marinus]UMA66996.1 hypothetical protein LVO79_18380 [Roseivivax marinus]